MTTAALTAIAENDLNALEASAGEIADLNAPLDGTFPALVLAAKRGHLQQVEWLLTKGAAVDATGDNGMTALQLAVMRGHLDLIPVLLAAKANASHQDRNGYTPLAEAAKKGYFNAIRMMLNAGANAAVEDFSGDTPASEASKRGFLKTAELLKHGPSHEGLADLDMVAETPSDVEEPDDNSDDDDQLTRLFLRALGGISKRSEGTIDPKDLALEIHQQLTEAFGDLPFAPDQVAAMWSPSVLDKKHPEYDADAEPLIDSDALVWSQQIIAGEVAAGKVADGNVEHWSKQLSEGRWGPHGLGSPRTFGPLAVMLSPLVGVDGLLRVLLKTKAEGAKRSYLKTLLWCVDHKLADRDYWAEQVWAAVFERTRLTSRALESSTSEGRTYDVVQAGPLIGHFVLQHSETEAGLDRLFAPGMQWMGNWHIMDPIKQHPGIVGRLTVGSLNRGKGAKRLPENDDEASWQFIREAIQSQTIKVSAIGELLKSLRHRSELGQELQTLALNTYSELIPRAVAGKLAHECVAAVVDPDLNFRLLPSTDRSIQRQAIRRVGVDWGSDAALRKQYPDAVANHVWKLTPEVLAELWDEVTTDESRTSLLTKLAGYAMSKDVSNAAEYQQTLETLWRGDPKGCTRLYLPEIEDYSLDYCLPVWHMLEPKARVRIARKRFHGEYGDEYSHRDRDPEIDLLIFRDVTFTDFEPLIEKHARSVKSRPYLVTAMSAQSADFFADHWLEHKQKDMRTLALEALLASDNPGVEPVLRHWHAQKFDETAKGLIRNRIEALGGAVDDIEPLPKVTPETVEAYSEKLLNKRQINRFEPMVTDDMREIVAPLGPMTLIAMLAFAAQAEWAALPRQCRQALGLLSRERQAQFAEQMLNLWLAHKGEKKMRWTLKFLQGFGDDRLIDDLVKAIKAWQKRAKPKAVAAIEAIASIDTPTALSQVEAYTAKRGNSWAIQNAAHHELNLAARRRGVTRAEMMDLLIPDFGMGPEGLTLDAGPRQYLVRILNDLSLRVKNLETGKVTKSLPKARVDEDAELRRAAEGQFKILRKNIKKVAGQQALRMTDALIGGKRWQAKPWQSLFVDHPVLSVMARGLIWVGIDEDGTPTGSFRISSDKSLVDAEDETVELCADSVMLWHPLEASDDEIGAWGEHLEDYEITPFVEQTGQAVHRLNENEPEADALARFRGVDFFWGDFKRRMSQWGFDVSDQDGSHIFGYYRHYPTANVTVQIDCEEANVANTFDDTMTMGEIEFKRGDEKLKLGEVPPRLMSSLIADIGLLKQP